MYPHRFSILLSPKWSSQKHATVYAMVARGRQRKQRGSFPSKNHNGASFTVATGNKQWPPIRVSLSHSAYQLLASALRQRESKADRNGSEGVGRRGLTWSGILFLHLKSSQISKANVTETRGLFKGTDGEFIAPSLTSLLEPWEILIIAFLEEVISD